VGGALTSALDWRWIFLINLPLGLACLWIVRRWVAESLNPRAPRVDRPGLITLTGGLFLLVFALLRGNEDGWASATIVASFGGAAALLFAFVAVEARVAQPMLPLRFFRNPSFTGAQVGAFGISAFAVRDVALHDALPAADPGVDGVEAGLVYVPGTMLNFFVAGATASVGQKVSARVLTSVGLALIGGGLALLTIVGVDSS
jgi:MFS family permease